MSALEDVRSLILGVHGRITSVDPDSAALRKDLNIALKLVDELLARDAERKRPSYEAPPHNGTPWAFTQDDYMGMKDYLTGDLKLPSWDRAPVLDFVCAAIREITRLRDLANKLMEPRAVTPELEIARRMEQAAPTVQEFLAIYRAAFDHAEELWCRPTVTSTEEIKVKIPMPEAPSQKEWLDIAEMAAVLLGEWQTGPREKLEIPRECAIHMAQAIVETSKQKASGTKLKRLEP